MSDWISKNPVLFTMVIWPVVTGIVTWLFKPRSPEQYAAMPARLGAVLKLIAAFGLDAPRVLEGLQQILTGVHPTSAKAPPLSSAAVKAASVPPPSDLKTDPPPAA
jgi:hypothetical protein